MTEQELMDALQWLADKWPKGYWLFTNGDLYLMKMNGNGERDYSNGSVNQDYILGRINIPSDGGDF